MRTKGASSSTGLRPLLATPPAWCYDCLPLRALVLMTVGVFAIVAIGGVGNSSADSPSQLVHDTIGGPFRPLQAFGTSQTDLLEEKRMAPSQAGVSDGKFLTTSLLTKVDTQKLDRLRTEILPPLAPATSRFRGGNSDLLRNLQLSKEQTAKLDAIRRHILPPPASVQPTSSLTDGSANLLGNLPLSTEQIAKLDEIHSRILPPPPRPATSSPSGGRYVSPGNLIVTAEEIAKLEKIHTQILPPPSV